jgi:hypothetical protein
MLGESVARAAQGATRTIPLVIIGVSILASKLDGKR